MDANTQTKGVVFGTLHCKCYNACIEWKRRHSSYRRGAKSGIQEGGEN